jgi:uncharacterized protein (DUF488 family)
MFTLATIGYEGTTVPDFIETLREARVELLVDVRAVASSRRPGFAKTRLSANVEEAGIGYLHMPRLGTPSEGRAAARSGRHAEMRRIFLEHLATEPAQQQLADLAEIIRSGRRVCILCFEADPAHCHRRMVALALAESMPLTVEDLRPQVEAD